MKNLSPAETEILDTIREKARELAALPPGFYQIDKPWWDLRSRKGWVHVQASKPYRNDPPGVSLMWTSSRDTHHPSKGPAFSLSFDHEGNLEMYSRSAISMHVIWSSFSRGGAEELREAAAGLEWMHSELAHRPTPEFLDCNDAAPVNDQPPAPTKRRSGPK